MPDQETIKGQLTLLDTFRKRLRVQIDQKGKLGAYAPPYMQTEIDDAQAQVKKIKAYLRANGREVEDAPEDDDTVAIEQEQAATPAQPVGGVQYPQSPSTIPAQPPPDPSFKYDVFISYNHADEQWVEKILLKTLEDAGLRVCIDFRDFLGGRAAVLNMQDAVRQSRHTVLVITKPWIDSEWTLFETLLTSTKDPAGLRRRTIPLRLQVVELPEFISMLTWIDFTRPDRQANAWRQLFTTLGEPAPVPVTAAAQAQPAQAPSSPAPTADNTSPTGPADVFVSYHPADKEWVRKQLLPLLEQQHGLRAIIDYRDFEIGVPKVMNIESAVADSRHTLIVLTPDWVASEWNNFHGLLASSADPSGLQAKLMPIILKPAALPDRIKLLEPSDLTDPDEREIQLQRLVRSIKRSRS